MREEASGLARWYLTDGLGSVLGEVLPSGAVDGKRKLDVYGVERSKTGTLSSQGFVGNLGHQTDEGTGLVYMRARYYDPNTGRFVSQDPAKSGNNWFAYCAGNPVNLLDASGNEMQVPVPGGGSKLPLCINSGLNATLMALVAGFFYALGATVMGNTGIWASVFGPLTVILSAVTFLAGFLAPLLKNNILDCSGSLKDAAKASVVTGSIGFLAGIVTNIGGMMGFEAGMILFHVFLVDSPEA